MQKKQEIDPNYYDNHCFADDFIEAEKRGELVVVGKGESTLEAIKRYAEARKKTAVSMRLPVYIINGVKAQAKKAGIPYTTYITAVLEKSIAKPQRRVAS